MIVSIHNVSLQQAAPASIMASFTLIDAAKATNAFGKNIVLSKPLSMKIDNSVLSYNSNAGQYDAYYQLS